MHYHKTGKQLQLKEDYRFHADLHIQAAENNHHPLIDIDSRGHLLIRTGFQCQSARLAPSAITARASIIYSALCTLLQQGVIAPKEKAKINEILVRLAMEDGLQPLLSIPMFWAQHLMGRQDGK